MSLGPGDTSWGFGPALDLIGGLNKLEGSPIFENFAPERPDESDPNEAPDEKDGDTLDLATDLPKLGDFTKLFETLGIPRHAPKIIVEPEEFDTDASYHSDEPLSSPPVVDEPLAPESPKVEADSDDVVELDFEPILQTIELPSKPEAKPGDPQRFLAQKEAKRERNRQKQEAQRLRNIAKKERKEQEKAVKDLKTAERNAQRAAQQNPPARSPVKGESVQKAQTQNQVPIVSGLIPSNAQPGHLSTVDEAVAASLEEKMTAEDPPLARPSSFSTGLMSAMSPEFIPQYGNMNQTSYTANAGAVQPYGSVPTPSPMGSYDQYLLSLHLATQSRPPSAPITASYAAAAQRTPNTRYPPRSNISANGNPMPTPLPPVAMPGPIETPLPTLSMAPMLPATPIPPRTPRMLSARSGEDRHEQLFLKIMRNFPEDKKWMVAPMQLSNNGMVADGIHVIVDASNILIGFHEVLKPYREGLKQSGIRRLDISFDSLILLLERRRPVAKRVLAGSTKSAPPLPAFQMAKAVGYEVNIMERVLKTKELTDRDLFFQDVNTKGWDTAIKARQSKSDESDSETGAFVATPQTIQKWVEQGVDELLHLKMLESVVDCWQAPGTMVIATGDAAPAEYSGGFMAQMERVLERGWKVELVSWKRQTSAAYRKPKFLKKWAEQFKIIELDEYLEELLDI